MDQPTFDPSSSPSKSRWKIYSTLVVVLIIAGALLWGYFWWSGISARLQLAEQTRINIEQCERLVDQALRENKRCADLIASGEGDFKEYDYCNQYTEFITPFVVSIYY